MIKGMGATADGTPLVILGLSRLNTERLLDGKPIQVPAADLAQLGLPPGGPGVLLLGGETEDALLEDLRAMGLQPQVEPARFVCPTCGKASSHPRDLAEGYCAACHAYTGAPTR